MKVDDSKTLDIWGIKLLQCLNFGTFTFFFLICKYIKTGIYMQLLLALCLTPNSVLYVLQLQWVLSKREKSKCILSYQLREVDAFKSVFLQK